MANKNYRDFHLTIISAENLPEVRNHFKSRVYCKVSFCGDKETEQRTQADEHGELNPTWNQSVHYKVLESGVEQFGLQLVIKLYCERTLGDRYIGEVYKSLKEIFDQAERSGGSARDTLPIRNGSTPTDGTLEISYAFGKPEEMKKPGFKKRVLLPGACILLKVVGAVTIGVDIPLQYNGTKFVDPSKVNT